jgi:hypothetical protein
VGATVGVRYGVGPVVADLLGAAVAEGRADGEVVAVADGAALGRAIGVC